LYTFQNKYSPGKFFAGSKPYPQKARHTAPLIFLFVDCAMPSLLHTNLREPRKNFAKKEQKIY